jgi:electron transport complex protein RnfG
MKKLLEKDMFRYTLVLTIVAIVCGLMIGGMNALTAPIIQRNLEEAERKAFQEVLPLGVDFDKLELVEGIPSSIQSAVQGLDASSKVVGYIYTASGTNQHGSISIVVSVDANGKILGASILSINQTKGIADTESNLKRFIGTQIGTNTPAGDIISGVTNSLNTVKALLTDISVAHGLLAVPSDPYVQAFGEGYTIVQDTTFVATTLVKQKDDVKNAANQVVGHIYTLSGAGDYDNGQEVVSGFAITIKVVLDLNQKVVTVELPQELYGHSGGARYTKISNYVNTLVGKNINQLESTLNNSGDLVSGVTGTRNLVDVLIDALVEEVN